MTSADKERATVKTKKPLKVKTPEQTLQESEDKFSSVFQISPYAIAITRLEDGRLIEVNDTFVSAIGFTREELLASSALDLKLWADEEDRARLVAALGEGRTLRGQEFRFRKKNGAVITCLYYAQIMQLNNEPCILSAIVDITERKQGLENLLVARNHLDNLINATPDPIFVKDREHKWVLLNDAFCLFIGRTREELLGKSDYDVFPKNEADMFWEKDEVVFRTKKENLNEEAFTSSNGITRTISTKKTLFIDILGNELLIGSIRDITEHKQTEESIAESERKFHSLFENMVEGVVLHEMIYAEDGKAVNYRIVDVNPSFERYTGLTGESIRGRLATEVYHTDAAPYLEIYERVARTGEPVSFESYFQPMQKHFFISVYSPKPGWFATVFMDITKHKLANEELRKSESEQRTLAQSLALAQVVGNLGSWETDIKTLDVLWSEQTHRIFETTPDTFRPTHPGFLNLVHPEDREAVDAAFQASANINMPCSIEHRIVMQDGRIKHVEEKWQTFSDAENHPWRAIGTCREITDRKRVEEDNARLAEQLQQAAKLEAIGKLAGGVAHDFNNLLTVILNYAQLAFDKIKEGDPLKDILLEVNKAGERAAALTRQLLAFGRNQVLKPVVLDLNQSTVGAEKMLRLLLGENIRLVLNLAPDLGLTLADPSQIEQVLMNLVVNARDAMPEGGKLTIETSNLEIDEEHAARHVGMKPGSYIQLVVTDTGYGMDERTMARIFEPFFTTKEKGKGTGLGLSMVYGIVQQSKGHIWVNSKPGRGATFNICLPRKLFAATATASTIPKVQKQATGSETILVVEDEEALLKVARRILDSAGYKVLSAADGHEALLTCARYEGDIHLLLTDMIMPKMNGAALAHGLLKTRPALKIIYMSGYTEDMIGDNDMIDEDANFLSKPFTADDLIRKVREVLDDSATTDRQKLIE